MTHKYGNETETMTGTVEIKSLNFNFSTATSLDPGDTELPDSIKVNVTAKFLVHGTKILQSDHLAAFFKQFQQKREDGFKIEKQYLDYSPNETYTISQIDEVEQISLGEFKVSTGESNSVVRECEFGFVLAKSHVLKKYAK